MLLDAGLADLRLADLGAAAHRRREGGRRCERPVDSIRPSTSLRELPTGTTLLEASAGTGKTWTIGALVTRYVAEGARQLEQMLVVTFGRAASQELRERVRAQLVEAERALGDDPAARAALDPGPPSDLVGAPPSWDDEQRRAGHRRVTEALAGFDAATIATTHQFCSMVLDSLGVAGDTDSRARLVEDLDDLVKEIVDDLYLRAFAFDEGGPVFSYAEALAIARAAVGDPQARLEPAGEDRTTPVGRRVSFAEAVRNELDRRKRRLGILSYDDLLAQLADALQAPTEPPRGRMRQRWRIVLVDEFQDTDPVQWQVLDRAFTGHATMVLIGDPKQAIYAFRGGDVTTYLDAAETATTQQTLSVNWRSDAALVAAFQALLGGAELGDPRIVVRPVEAHHDGSRLAGAPQPAPFRVRVVRRQDLGKRSSALTVGEVRPHIAEDLALDVRRCSRRVRRSRRGELRPRDVAVISYRHADLAAARQALLEVGVPAVIAGGGSVFATPAAVEWLTLLEALEQPHRSARVRSAALTCFFGRTAAELDAHGDDLTDEVAETLRAWAELFTTRGIAAVLEAATVDGLPARVLAEVGGERRLTDLRHIGEALHEVALTERLGLVSLLTWLREQVAEARRAAAPSAPAASTPTPPRSSWSPSTPARGWSTPSSTCPRSPTGTWATRSGRCSTTPRTALPQRRRRRCRLGRPLPPLARRGGRRVAAAALRRDHPRPVAGRVLVGADQERPRLAAAPDADACRGHQHGRAGTAAAERRRGRRAVRALAGARRSGARAGAPSRARRRPPGARDARTGRPRASPARSTPPGGARRTPR